ncbi:13997_t:CDS:2 [Acaulospora colombiana]|uniref:13997_t:CDS:1 n=1 Tax=Acaulospora colombiana TaxID=27376 RepID=A0ACA9LLG9_9GLOM|nr:13997_t:CDS:2 [Acaulospora colombiana]
MELSNTQNAPTEWIDFISKTMNSGVNPLLDRTPINAIYLSFRYKKFNAHIERDLTVPSEEFRMSIIHALKNPYPHKELMNTFVMYGHFVPQKVIIGHKLYKISCIYDEIRHSLNEILVNIDVPSKRESEIRDSCCENILRQWKSIVEPYGVDQNYFISTSGEIIKESNIEEWIRSCNLKTLQIIGYEDLLPSYEILEEPLRYQVKSIIGIENDSFIAAYNTLTEPIIPKIKERVFMSGTIPLKNTNKYYHVTFTRKLDSENYRILGKLNHKNLQDVSINQQHITVKFRSLSAHGFLALIEHLEDSNTQLDWIAIGIPSEVGCYDLHTRNIFILNMGMKSITPRIRNLRTMDLLLEVTPNLPPNSYLTTVFEYPPSNDEPKLRTALESYNGDKLNLRIINNEDSKTVDCCESDSKVVWYILTFHEGKNVEFASEDFMRKIGENIYKTG